MLTSTFSTVLFLVAGLLCKLIAGTAVFTTGDPDDGSAPGIIVENKSGASSSYYFYQGTGNFNLVYKYVAVPAGQSAFVSLPLPWQGYIQRGTDQLNLQGQVNMPMTMVEFQLGASDGTGAHGDISLEQGHDGAATICSTTTSACGGFTQDIIQGAPDAAFEQKPDGSLALGTTMGNWAHPPNRAAIAWEQSRISQTAAYITGGTGTFDIASANNRLTVAFFRDASIRLPLKILGESLHGRLSL